MPKKVDRIYRSRQDKIIGGVCGGIAEHLNIDPLWIRLATVLLALIEGVGIVLYIVAWIIIPENPKQKKGKTTKAEEVVGKAHKKIKNNNKDGLMIFGIALILLGIFFLLDQFIPAIPSNIIWPTLLIGIGVVLIIGRKKK